MVTITSDELEVLLKKHKSAKSDERRFIKISNESQKAKGRLPESKLNKTESEYASMLAARNRIGEIQWWRFEAIRLKLADRTTYTPDFAVMLADGSFEFHETKGGFIRDDAIAKLKIAAEMYPFFRFVLCKKNKSGWTFREV